jgi:hypothetical protein
MSSSILRPIVGAVFSLASLALVWGCQSVAGIEERELGPCGEFCDTVMSNCTGENQVYDTRDKCMALCELLPPGDTVEPGRTNTVECRLREARKAGTALSEDVNRHCRSAGPEAIDCGGPCHSYCTLFEGACGPDKCGSYEGCLHACSALLDRKAWDLEEDHDGDTLQCRLVHLENASIQPNQHCPHSQIIAPTAFCNWTIDEGKVDPDRPTAPDCKDYCRVVGVACSGDNAVYESDEQCLAVCEEFQGEGVPGSGEFTDRIENTIGCRIYHAYNSLCAPAQHCSHAAISGDGHCGELEGGNCASYCHLAQRVCETEYEDEFSDEGDCLETCSMLDGQAGDSKYSVLAGMAEGDSLHCRFLALSRAALDTNECPAAFGDAPCSD